MTDKELVITEEHKVKFAEIRADYIKQALSTKPADHARVESGIRRCYELAGLAKPRRIIWVDSPMAGGDVVGKGEYSNHLGGRFWLLYQAYLRALLYAGWKPTEDIMKRIDAYEDAQQACVWWAFDEMAVVSEPPVTLKVDDQMRPHCQDAPAIQWKDGESLSYFHGVAIPNAWVTGKLPSPGDALKWENVEQRRAACELIGWGKILTDKKLKPRTIDRDDDPMIGELIEVDLPQSGNDKFLRVRCGTGRDFVLPVPPEMTTALQANAWTFGLPDDVLKKGFLRT